MAEAEAVVNAESVVCEGEAASVSVKETDHGAPEVTEEGTTEVSVEIGETHDVQDNKRKLEDLEPLVNDEAPAKKQHIRGSEPITEAKSPIEEQATAVLKVAALEVRVQETEGSGLVHVKMEDESLGNGQIPSIDDIQHASANDTQQPFSTPLQDGLPHSMHETPFDHSSSTRKIDVPNDKVGVLIGKFGETVKYLQINSGAKIEITHDTVVDPYSSTRPVELIGTLESVIKAEQLIKSVIAEADAGGSPALVARGFSALQSGDEQTEIQVPNEKVGMIIGKGGETIKNIQAKTGARIQLIPQHLPKGDVSKERTVRITGNIKQVDSAKEMIKVIMNQIPSRTSNTFRQPRGPPATQWGPRSTSPVQQTDGCNHQYRGMHSHQTAQYPQPYAGYSQQRPPRATYGSTWVQQRPPSGPIQCSSPLSGYDYQMQSPMNNYYQMQSPMNNYYQMQSPDAYGHSTQQQKYGQGYGNEPKYNSQPPGQQQQQLMGPQPGMYGPQSAPIYDKLADGAPHEVVARIATPGDQMYQGAPQNHYPSSAPVQQQYLCSSNAPAQQVPPYIQQATYGPTSAAADGYSQQPAAGYSQYGHPIQPAPGYGQPVPQSGGYSQYPSQPGYCDQTGQSNAGYTQHGQPAQPGPGYGQPVSHSGGYSQYPSSQPSYGDQTAQSNVNYGYQGAAPDAAYAGSVPSSSYAAQQPVAGQPPVYSQTPANPTGYYDQSMPPQSGCGAPVTYSKSISPQPGYGSRYDSGQTYAQ